MAWFLSADNSFLLLPPPTFAFFLLDGDPNYRGYYLGESNTDLRWENGTLIYKPGIFSPHMAYLAGAIYYVYSSDSASSFSFFDGSFHLTSNRSGCVWQTPHVRGLVAAKLPSSQEVAVVGLSNRGTTLAWFTPSTFDTSAIAAVYPEPVGSTNSSVGLPHALSLIEKVSENTLLLRGQFFHSNDSISMFAIRPDVEANFSKIYVGDSYSCGGKAIDVRRVHVLTGNHTLLASYNGSVFELFYMNAADSSSFVPIDVGGGKAVYLQVGEVSTSEGLPVILSPGGDAFHIAAHDGLSQNLTLIRVQLSPITAGGSQVLPLNSLRSYAHAARPTDTLFLSGVDTIVFVSPDGGLEVRQTACLNCLLRGVMDGVVQITTISSGPMPRIYSYLDGTTAGPSYSALDSHLRQVVVSPLFSGLFGMKSLSLSVSCVRHSLTYFKLPWTADLGGDVLVSEQCDSGVRAEPLILAAGDGGVVFSSPLDAGGFEYGYWNASLNETKIFLTTDDDRPVSVRVAGLQSSLFLVTQDAAVGVLDAYSSPPFFTTLHLESGQRNVAPAEAVRGSEGLKWSRIAASVEETQSFGEPLVYLVYLPWRICSSTPACPQGQLCTNRICQPPPSPPPVESTPPAGVPTSSACPPPPPVATAICQAGVWVVQGTVNTTVTIGSTTVINGSLVLGPNATLTITTGGTLNVTDCATFGGILDVTTSAPSTSSEATHNVSLISFGGYCGNTPTRFNTTRLTINGAEQCAKVGDNPSFNYNERLLSVTFIYDRTGCGTQTLSPLLSDGAIAGIVVGIVAFIAIVITVILVLKFKKVVRPYASRADEEQSRQGTVEM